MTLSTLAQIRKKMEQAEKILREREAPTAYIVTYDRDSEEVVQAKIEAALRGRSPESVDVINIHYKTIPGEFHIGEGGLALSASEPKGTSGLVEEAKRWRAFDTEEAKRSAAKREYADYGIEPEQPKTGLKKRGDY